MRIRGRIRRRLHRPLSERRALFTAYDGWNRRISYDAAERFTCAAGTSFVAHQDISLQHLPSQQYATLTARRRRISTDRRRDLTPPLPLH